MADIKIPDEVVKAALSAYKYASSDVYTTEEHDMAEALAAALNAWQRSFVKFSRPDDCEILCLPLPQEKPND